MILGPRISRGKSVRVCHARFLTTSTKYGQPVRSLEILHSSQPLPYALMTLTEPSLGPKLSFSCPIGIFPNQGPHMGTSEKQSFLAASLHHNGLQERRSSYKPGQPKQVPALIGRVKLTTMTRLRAWNVKPAEDRQDATLPISRIVLLSHPLCNATTLSPYT